MTEHLAMAVAAVASDQAFPTDLVTAFVNLGLIGLLLLDVLATQRFIVPRRSFDSLSHERDLREQVLQATIDRLAAEITELKSMNEGLQDVARERMIPALVQSTDAVRSMVDMVGRMAQGGFGPR